MILTHPQQIFHLDLIFTNPSVKFVGVGGLALTKYIMRSLHVGVVSSSLTLMRGPIHLESVTQPQLRLGIT